MTKINLIEKLYSLNFTTNTFADKKHENLVKETIKSLGISETKDLDIIKILKDDKNKNKIVNELSDNFIFIEQPFGSQKSPDFIVCIDGFIIWIECKSGKNKITWNTGYPTRDTLYVFSCKKKDTTTIFLGYLTEIWEKNENFEKDYNDFDKEMKKITKKIFGDKFKTKNFDFYMRRMLNDKTKYSNTEVREDFFSKTLDFFNL
jgi:hypothetical protein